MTNNFQLQDEKFMREALSLALEARNLGEVPVGALVVFDGKVVGRGSNCSIRNLDPTAHAEIVALRDASKTLGNYRLPGAELFVTLEPCTMCAGAIINARIKRVVFAAFDKRAGAISSCLNVFDENYHNHNVEWSGGVLSEKSSDLLRAFFRERR